VKPRYKRSREEDNEHNEDDKDTNDEVQPITKIRVESGPQDPPKLSAAKLYGTMHKLVPNACVFTIDEPPTTDDPPASHCDASVEQVYQQNDGSSVVSSVEAELTQSSDTLHTCDMAAEQPCGDDASQISENIELSESSSALLDASRSVQQSSESTSILPEGAEIGSCIDLPSPLSNHFRSILCIDATDISCYKVCMASKSRQHP